MEKKERYEIKVKRIEEGSKNYLKVVFGCYFGEYSLEINTEKYKDFLPGRNYLGVFEVSGMKDFIGDEDKWENVCTVSYRLEKILDDEVVVWEK
ncbi:hypothetical protein HOD29_05350 [archaeon]|jgi:hypothetical protein|nr:hypothetical protein [archaeon]